MDIIATTPPHLRHPSWCSPQHCTAPDRLEQRGVDEHDVPIYLRSAHLSEPVEIGVAGRSYDVAFTITTWRMVNQPPTDEPDGLDMVITWMDQLHVVSVPIDPSQIGQLAETFARLAELVGEGDL